jgi:adenosylcobinamide-GDP ribazoletransferase
MTAFFLALQFLTRLPVTLNATPTAKQLGLSVLTYPLVGLLIGGVLVGLALLLNGVALATQAALILAFWIILTGGLHLDGLADCADAWAGGFGDKPRSLAIMKDPHVGAIAVVTLALILLVKWSCLQTVLSQHNGLALCVTPMLGRTAILILMVSTPYLSENGLGAVLTQNLPKKQTQAIVFISILIGLLSLGSVPLLCGGLMLFGIRHLALQRLQGVTGDVYGASVELVEATVLMGLSLV